MKHTTIEHVDKINNLEIIDAESYSDEISLNGRDKLAAARFIMLDELPFFGSTACQLIEVEIKPRKLTDNEWEHIQAHNKNNTFPKIDISRDIDVTWLGTAMTDGKYLYWDSLFFNELLIEEVVFVLCHEVLHCALNHVGYIRSRERNQLIWNLAIDYVVNGILKREQVGMMPFDKQTLEPIGLYNSEFDGMAAEEVYNILYNELPRKQKQRVLDKHISSDTHGVKSIGNIKEAAQIGPIKNTDKEQEEIDDEFQSVLRMAAQLDASKGIGKVPGEIDILIKIFTSPEISWEELLVSTFKSTLLGDRSFSRPSKKMLQQGLIIPGTVPVDAVDVGIFVDISGSMSIAMINECFSEVFGLTEQYMCFKLLIGCFDTRVIKDTVKVITEYNIDELENIKPVGGGGTSFSAVWKYLENENITMERLIILTDGYSSFHDCDPYMVDTVWLINSHGGNHDFEPPFGSHAFWPEKNYKETNV